MGTMLQDGVAWLARQLEGAAGRDVTYTRGDESVSLSAVPAEVDIEALDAGGMPIRAHLTDWILRADQLVLAGQPVQPEAGDRIRAARGVRFVTYEVMSLGDLKHFEPMDPDYALLRVHTKQVKIE